MRQLWIYDWEVYFNFACVTFLHTSTPKQYIEAYKNLDIKYLHVRNAYNKSLESGEVDEELEEEFKVYKRKKVELLTVMNVKQFIIFNDRDDKSNNICQLGELLMFFINHKVLMGYNSYNYDSLITDYIMIHGRKYDTVTGKHYNTNSHICNDLKHVSDEIINHSNSENFGYKYSWKPSKYYRTFEDYDIQKILYLDKTFVGLKSVAINLRWHRIQELPLEHDTILGKHHIWDMLDYNVNDVMITYVLTMQQSEEITLREEISQRYDINVLNESRSSIGKRLMSKYYEEESGIPYREFKDLRTNRGVMRLSSIISDSINFTTDNLKEFMKNLRNSTVSPGTEFERKIFVNDTFYKIAKGGIHSVDDSRIYDSSKDGYIYRDADVTSYYPSILEIFRIAPKHLSTEIFLKLVSFFKNDRVRAKKAGAKLEAESLKIVINRIYGALSDAMDYLFDPKATYQTTFNGQLSLLMLIETLEENGISVISANTDGIVAKFKPEQEELYNSICKDWEIKTKFELEYTDYEKYVRTNVNNYIAIKKGFKDSVAKLDTNDVDYAKKLKELEAKYVKSKGSYSSETPFQKGFIYPIVSIALIKYILYDIPYRDTIVNHVKEGRFNIYDYCMSQKVDRKFDVVMTSVVNGEIVTKPLQQYNRFYVVRSKGCTLIKHNPNNGRSSSILAKYRVEVLNDFEEKEDYDLHYGFYISKVEDYLYFKKKNSKGNHKLEGIVVRSNTLFS